MFPVPDVSALFSNVVNNIRKYTTGCGKKCAVGTFDVRRQMR